MRSVAAEKAYNRRWLTGLLVGLLVQGVGAAVWMLSVAGRLPAEPAIHWNSKNAVDNWASLGSIALSNVPLSVGAGGVLAALAVVSRGQNTLMARIGAGLGVGFGLAMSALMVAVVAGQLDLVDTSQATLSGPVLGGGLAVAFGMGTAVTWLYRPGDIDRTQGAEVLAVNAAAASAESELSAAAKTRADMGESLEAKVSMGSWAWVFSLGLGVIVAVGAWFIFPLLSLLGVVIGGITWIFCHGTVVIGADGVKVLASGFWKVMPLEWREIRSASVEDIKAMDYGGWGYRMNGGSVGFIMGNGPAIVIEAGFHQKFVVSMPDVAQAGEAAALVNAYACSGKVKN